ncbi:MAG: lysoplasmalogenase [Paracoccaceae bacterium]|nr:lysoplasmalogenase [Paracoccaceae bacterium]
MGADNTLPLTLWGISLLAALAYPLWPMRWPGTRALIKTSAVGALALLASLGPYWGLALALGLSAVGDFALTRPGERAFLIGMAAFGLAHLAYIFVFVGLGAGLAYLQLWEMALGLALIGAALWLGRTYARQAGALRWPLYGYVTVIALMGITALMLPGQELHHLVLFGSLLFICSDALLGKEVFLRQIWRGQAPLLWALYYFAQVCLFAGVATILG